MSEWNKIEMKENILQIWSNLVLYPKHSVFKIGKMICEPELFSDFYTS